MNVSEGRNPRHLQSAHPTAGAQAARATQGIGETTELSTAGSQKNRLDRTSTNASSFGAGASSSPSAGADPTDTLSLSPESLSLTTNSPARLGGLAGQPCSLFSWQGGGSGFYELTPQGGVRCVCVDNISPDWPKFGRL